MNCLARSFPRLLLLSAVLGVWLVACPSPTSPTPAESQAANPVPVYNYQVLKAYPHDPDAFTQGLAFDGGILYEGTGLYSRSSLRRVDLESGTVLQTYQLPSQFFGEGVTIYKDQIIQLTWQSHTGFVYDKASFKLLREFRYFTEGWGITHNGKRMMMSDGTSTLHLLDTDTFEEIGQIEVHDKGTPVTGLNELEYVNGQVYANVWPTDRIAIIAPDSGRVVGWIELSGLLGQEFRDKPVDVLNGIAYETQSGRLFVTGKLWPRLFEIKLVATK